MADYSIGKLAEEAECTVRTIRHYISEGVLPTPESTGKYAKYTTSHLNRLRLIQRLKESFLPLAEIRKRITNLSDSEVESLLSPTPNTRLQSPNTQRLTPNATRHTWERIEIDVDLELHLRHPLSSGAQEIADRLLSIVENRQVPLAIATHSSNTQIGTADHPHPCNFRLHRKFDRGWGELAFEYRWDSTSGVKTEDGIGNPDIAHCLLFELTSYAGNVGTWEGGSYAPNHPFLDWRFRDPTDGRNAEVGMESFPADQGWAWDRHKLGGRLLTDEPRAVPHPIIAIQTYYFHCELCGVTSVAPGNHSGPHPILRVYGPCTSPAQLIPATKSQSQSPGLSPLHSRLSAHAWRYLCQKHGYSAWMDIDSGGFLQDSAGLDFGPWDAPTQIDAAEWALIES